MPTNIAINSIAARPGVSPANVSAFSPVDIGFQANKAWPAPMSIPAIEITGQGERTLAIGKSNAGQVIGASIFGGAVTAGDPDSVYVHTDDYTREAKPVVGTEGFGADDATAAESWMDVFGGAHGQALPGRRGRLYGKMMYNVPAPMASFGAFGIDAATQAKVDAAKAAQLKFIGSKKNEPMSTGAKVAIGVGAVALVGAAFYFLKK